MLTDSNSSTESALNATIRNASSEVTDQLTLAVVKWINGLIIILGLITNSLILVILSRSRKIGSGTTRIILMFLAATDLFIMVVELFLHYIPLHWQWFPIFYNDFSCGFAFWIQASITATSAWYLMLMTSERFAVVYFPIKAKIICTKRKIVGACIAIPLLSLVCFSYLLTDIRIVESKQFQDYMECAPKEQNERLFKSKIILWIMMYFFIPAIAIVTLNTAIVIRLSQAHKIQQQMTVRSGSVTEAGRKTGGGTSRKFIQSPSQQSASSQSIRKATTLVVAASITFVVLMIPRGVSTMMSLDIEWDYRNRDRFIFDHAAYQLQYLNHAINFFLYILANRNFRSELRKMMPCYKRKHASIKLRTAKLADSEVTQTTIME
ncbi:galanin receptor 2b-like isoform X2 [Watersipora subatra]|uniref:galanin receptor 2b-like isoform X2 n=1 Tax=Watersipora subatra TaxID=2589382 RepID=UPI00355AF5CA